MAHCQDHSFQLDVDSTMYNFGCIEDLDPYEIMIASSSQSKHPESITSRTTSVSRTLPPPQSSEEEITPKSVKLNRASSHPSLETPQSTSAELSVGLKQDAVAAGGDDRAPLQLVLSFLPLTSGTPIGTSAKSLPVNDNNWIAEDLTKKEAGPRRKAIVVPPTDLIHKLQQDKIFRQKEIKSIHIHDNSKYWSITFTDGEHCCVCNIPEPPSASACLTICRNSRGINRHFKAAKHIGDKKAYHCTHATHPCEAAFSRHDALTRHLKEVRHPRLTQRQKRTSSAGSKGRKVGKKAGVSANKYRIV